MNGGANVPMGVLLRFELDRSRVESLRPNCGLLSCVRDWCRTWPIFGSGSASGDMTSDLGRVVLGEPGVGDGVFLAKGLLRELRAKGRPFCAGALIVVDSDSGGRCDGPTFPLCRGSTSREEARMQVEQKSERK